MHALLIKMAYFSKFRAIWRWTAPKQQTSLKFLEYEETKPKLKRALHSGTTKTV